MPEPETGRCDGLEDAGGYDETWTHREVITGVRAIAGCFGYLTVLHLLHYKCVESKQRISVWENRKPEVQEAEGDYRNHPGK